MGHRNLRLHQRGGRVGSEHCYSWSRLRDTRLRHARLGTGEVGKLVHTDGRTLMRGLVVMTTTRWRRGRTPTCNRTIAVTLRTRDEREHTNQSDGTNHAFHFNRQIPQGAERAVPQLLRPNGSAPRLWLRCSCHKKNAAIAARMQNPRDSGRRKLLFKVILLI